MKFISVLAAVLVSVGAEKRSDFSVFGGQMETGFLPIVGHHDDQYIKSFSIPKKLPFHYTLNNEKKVLGEKPHQFHTTRSHTACSEKRVPQPITIEKHVLVPVKIPIMKPYPVYVEKKVPYQVEKKIPYFMYRPFPFHTEKPLTYNLKEENQFTFPVIKPSPLSVNNQVAHHADGTSTSAGHFKLLQEGQYTGDGNKAQVALQEGYDGSEYFFGDYFGKGFQHDASDGNVADHIGKQQGARELSNTNKQIYI